ncbi:TPA: tyrosine-type recombinase/integrase [Vibrio parahaemolyticus]|nr:tyrosine-type recombinase/integrase [Vibrio parahaemolyticus]
MKAPIVLHRNGDIVPVRRDSDVVFISGRLDKETVRASTRRLYASKLAKVERLGYTLPLYDHDLVRFIEGLATNHTYSTIVGYVSAVKWYHHQHDLPTPDRYGLVKQSMKSLRKLKTEAGEQPTKAAPLVNDDLKLISDFYQKAPSARNDRNRIIIMLMYYAALRRQELVNLNIGDLWFSNRGVAITLRVTKNNKNHVFIGRNEDEPDLCVVSSLETFIAEFRADCEKDSPLFLSVHSSGRTFKNSRLTTNAVSDLVKYTMSQIGSQHADQYSGHSPRRGYVTDAVQLNENVIEISSNARMSVEVVKSYAEVSGSNVTDGIMHKMAEKRKTKTSN